jgi:uncharacterized repeat protein (TIGR03803 family)
VDGAEPIGRLAQGSDGNFYGTTQYGGSSSLCSNGCGTAFNITPTGIFTTLYDFCPESGCVDGYYPQQAPAQATNGTFYGTAPLGGTGTLGTAYSLSVGLGPFVETLPSLGGVGATVTILGTNLTGATSVTFNGVAASFTVASSGTALKATVPSGATTGPVQLVTPSGTLISNTTLRVAP